MTGIILALFVALALAVVVARAALWKPLPDDAPSGAAVDPVDARGAAERLAALIRIPTVTNGDPELFEEFRATLRKLYPAAHKALSLEIVAGHAMLYRWKGKGAGDPLVLMSHYDVVPAPDEGWAHPPFSGDIADGKVWGRGTLDTKCTLVCAFEAVEALVKKGFEPERDVYLSFGHNEETAGDGAIAIVKRLEELGVRPGLVLDEGGAIVEGLFPGVDKPLAMVGVAEKGVTDIELSVKSSGGHSSTPPKQGAAWRLARALMRIEAHPFPGRFPAATKVMLGTLGRYAGFGLRVVMANLWLFEGLLLKVFSSSGGELNAVCRTTTAFTMLEGSKAANVLPAEAKATVNVRLAIGATVDGIVERLRKVIADPKVELRVLHAGEPSPVSELSGERFSLLSETIREVYPKALVAPYVVLGGTDARHYSHVSKTVYRFSPFELSKAERASMHAVNETIGVDSLGKGVEFYLRLIGKH